MLVVYMGDPQWQIEIYASFVKEVLMNFHSQVMMDSTHLQPIFWNLTNLGV